MTGSICTCVSSVFRLAEQLPRASAALLRHVFGMLHNVQLHSSANKMTAYNLSVCVAPSILCLPTSSSSSELEADLTKKVLQPFTLGPGGQSPHFEPNVYPMNSEGPVFEVHTFIMCLWSGSHLS